MVIVGDTKLTPIEGDLNNKYTGNPLDGVIKIIVVNSNLCVCFAGDISPAEEAYREIRDFHSAQHVFTVVQRHSMSGTTEFLVCSGNPLRIFKVSKGIVHEEESSWIGSARAFERYQGYFLKKIDPPFAGPTLMAVEPTFVKPDSPLAKVAAALDHVIGDGSIPEVGGFRVSVHWLNGSFQYKGYIRSYQGIISINAATHSGQSIIPIGLGSPQEGAYNINFFGSDSAFKYAAVHIREGKLGLVYFRQDFGLMKAHAHKMDEVDFVDFVRAEYGFGPAMTTQNREEKFLLQGDTQFKEGLYVDAIKSFEKVIAENGKFKGRSMYRKGIVLINLKRIPEGIFEINKAITVDPSLFQEGVRLVQMLSRFYIK